MKQLIFREGTLEDALSLAPRLRPEDALEVVAFGEPAAEALKASLECAEETLAAVEDGVVIALGGITIKGSFGVPWFLGSKESVKYPLQWVKMGKTLIARWEKKCSVMTNFTHPDNTVHHQWLEHLGFTFLPGTVPYGPFNTPFRQFYRSSPCALPQS